jgi:hypothetical protein
MEELYLLILNLPLSDGSTIQVKDFTEMTQKEFADMYFTLKNEGLTDQEIVNRLFTNRVILNAYKEVYGIETIKVRKNRVGVTEEHFRKGERIGLDRRTILRRVRDGVSIDVAINTPKQTMMRLKK